MTGRTYTQTRAGRLRCRPRTAVVSNPTEGRNSVDCTNRQTRQTGSEPDGHDAACLEDQHCACRREAAVKELGVVESPLETALGGVRPPML